MSQLYFNNNPKQDVNLKKAEILIYYKKGGSINYKVVGFPNVIDTTINKEPNSEIILVDNISSNFYPISMTMWGKDYDVLNKFRMVEINDNGTNVTTFEVKNNTISMAVKIGKILSKSNITNFGVNDTKDILSKQKDYPILIGKIIILYDDQSEQSLIKQSDIKEMYNQNEIYNKMYIGIM